MKLLVTAALAVALGTGCAPKPQMILGARMPASCSGTHVAEERCLGWIMDRLMVTMLRPYRDADLNAYVTSVGNRLVRAHGDHRAWTFSILDTDVQNAYAGIGTHLYVNRGILTVLRDEDELAAVLGHEIGHALGGHTHAALMTSQTWREKRDDEIQADETGVKLLAEAGYDVAAMPRMLRAIAVDESNPPDDDPTSSYPPWFERIARAEISAATFAHTSVPRITGGEQRYLHAIASLVVGVDPRDHAMIGTTALFSDIGIAIDVPEHQKPEITFEALEYTVLAPELHTVDMRVLNHAVALTMPSGAHDTDMATHLVPGRRDSPYGRQLDLLITVKGPLATDVLSKLVRRVRTIRRDELAEIRPAYLDLSAPRKLWAPPAPVATK